MRKTLEELFYGNLTPNEQQITPDSPLQQAMDQAEKYEEMLRVYQKLCRLNKEWKSLRNWKMRQC